MSDKVFLLPDLNNRIKILIDKYSKGSVSSFAKTLNNISQQKLNRILIIDKRTNKIPSVPNDILVAISERYSEVNSEWLLTGNGEMIKMIKENNVQKNEVENNKDIVGIQGNGNTINNNPNDMSNLIKMIEDKDYIIAKLRKTLEEQHDSMVEKLYEKESNCSRLLEEKDRFIMKLIEDRDAMI